MSAPFTIGYDASTALLSGGIPRYVRELLLSLGKLDEDFRIVALVNSMRQRDAALEESISAHPRMTLVRRRLPGPLLVGSWARFRAPSFERLAGVRCDVVHGPAGYVPAARAPIVVTAHDLCFLRESGGNASHFARQWPRLLPAVAGVICPSRHVSREVVERFRLPAGNCRAIHSGIDVARFNRSVVLPEEDRRRLLLPERFVLAVTDASSRKRPELLQATCDLLGESVPVVIAGLGAGAATKVGPGRIVLPRVSDATLAGVYAAANAVILTTREEGFGFPLLEALACGTPVVCGRHSSLAEIGGELPDYVDDESAAGFASGVMRVFERGRDDDWTARAAAHVEGFSWARTAGEHLRFYREAAGISS